MIYYELFDMPEGIVAAAHRFASEIQKEGYESALIMVHGGGVSYVSIAEDDYAHFMKLINGNWYELLEVSDPCEQSTTNLST